METGREIFGAHYVAGLVCLESSRPVTGLVSHSKVERTQNSGWSCVLGSTETHTFISTHTNMHIQHTRSAFIMESKQWVLVLVLVQGALQLYALKLYIFATFSLHECFCGFVCLISCFSLYILINKRTQNKAKAKKLIDTWGRYLLVLEGKKPWCSVCLHCLLRPPLSLTHPSSGVYRRNERMFLTVKPLSTASLSPSSHCQVPERNMLCICLFLSHCEPSCLDWGCPPQYFKGPCNSSLWLRFSTLFFLDSWQHMIVIHVMSSERSLPIDIWFSSLFFVRMYMWTCMHMSMCWGVCTPDQSKASSPSTLNIFWKTFLH